MASTADVSAASRERERKRRKKRTSLDLDEHENNTYQRQSTATEHFPLHDMANGVPDKVSPQNPQSTSNNSAEGSVGLAQGDRKVSSRTRRPRRRAKMENGDVYEEEMHGYDAQGERKRYSRRPPSGARHGVRRSASAEIIGPYEEYALNGEGLSPARRRNRKKRMHGSREFGEGEEINDDLQGTNTLNREQRDHEKRPKPRKHKPKKPISFRVQNVTSAEEDNYNADVDGEVSEAFFKVDKEDIVNEAPSQSSTGASGPVLPPPTANVQQTIPSQPLDVVFIERMDGHGFRSERKSKLAQAEAEIKDISPLKQSKQETTAEFALSVHKAFRSFSLFCHGLLAGLALAQCIFVYSLSSHSNGDTVFLTYYHKLAQPVQSLYYMLFAVCTVSVFDRYDMANPRSGFFQGLLTRPSRILAISAYLFALVFSISVANIDDRISLYSSQKKTLWKDSEISSLLETWRIINLMRVLGAVLGWALISLQPSKDYTAQNLYTDVDPVVGSEEVTRTGISAQSRHSQLA